MLSFWCAWNGVGIVWRQDERDQEHQEFLVKCVVLKSLILVTCVIPELLKNAGTIVPREDPAPALLCILCPAAAALLGLA